MNLKANEPTSDIVECFEASQLRPPLRLIDLAFGSNDYVDRIARLLRHRLIGLAVGGLDSAARVQVLALRLAPRLPDTTDMNGLEVVLEKESGEGRGTKISPGVYWCGIGGIETIGQIRQHQSYGRRQDVRVFGGTFGVGIGIEVVEVEKVGKSVGRSRSYDTLNVIVVLAVSNRVKLD
jgi:hypothetical protein